MLRRLAWVFSPFVLGISAFGACSPVSPGNAGGFGGDGSGAAAQGGNGTGADTGLGAGGAGQGGQVLSGTGGSGGIKECAALSAQAEAALQPADIIIAVDTSGSMSEESAEVQANLNNFASIITSSGIDVHVVLIADNTVCIPAPLGSGSCGGADEKLPSYRHVVQTVNSNDGLQVILNTYPQWKDSLRPGATKTIAIVSDDDSDLSANAFSTQLVALDPTFMGYKFDAIVSFTSPDSCIFGGCFFNCGTCTNPCCDKSMFCTPLSAAEGTVYKQLVMQTMGVSGDLCAQNFDPVFQDMATAVVQNAQLSCDYPIPPPPDGQTFDPTKVNVKYTPGGGGEVAILNVATPADCGMLGGWYYDNPAAPTTILMCPGTCDTLKADANGKIDVLFGCETEIKPPE